MQSGQPSSENAGVPHLGLLTSWNSRTKRRHLPMENTSRRVKRSFVPMATQSFGCGVAAIGGAADHLDQRITCLIDGHFACQNTRHIDIDMFRHGA